MTVPCTICKLCGSTSAHRFSLYPADGFSADYYECRSCGLLQSCHLDLLSDDEMREFYALPCAVGVDTGAAWRQYCVVERIQYLAACKVIPTSAETTRVLDVGCGSGFVVGWLRHRFCWEVFGYDPYTAPAFAVESTFTSWEEVVEHGPYHLVIASEVLEHLVNPRQEIAKIGEALAKDEAAVYVTTGVYLPAEHDHNWKYLAPRFGQHVALYSRASLIEVARILGGSRAYNVGSQNEWLFVKSAGNAWRRSRAYVSAVSSLLRAGIRLEILRAIE